VKTAVASETGGKTERKYAETLEYYLVAFFRRSRTASQAPGAARTATYPRRIHMRRGNTERAVGSVLNLRGYFQKYFDGFMESAAPCRPSSEQKSKRVCYTEASRTPLLFALR
jgi:hypothetical protein